MKSLPKIAVSKIAAASLIAIVATGCSHIEKNNPALAKNVTEKSVVSKVVANNNDLYEVMHEGRYYVFDDHKVYQDFLTVGETSYRKVFIGEGPQNETLVFGLRSKDKKKFEGIAGVDMYQGNLKAADAFYGEMRREDGRLYIFSSLEDMEAVRKIGEAAYRFTQIGVGPNGETVVFVLNKSNKKHRPDALIAQFKTTNKL